MACMQYQKTDTQLAKIVIVPETGRLSNRLLWVGICLQPHRWRESTLNTVVSLYGTSFSNVIRNDTMQVRVRACPPEYNTTALNLNNIP